MIPIFGWKKGFIRKFLPPSWYLILLSSWRLSSEVWLSCESNCWFCSVFCPHYLRSLVGEDIESRPRHQLRVFARLQVAGDFSACCLQFYFHCKLQIKMELLLGRIEETLTVCAGDGNLTEIIIYNKITWRAWRSLFDRRWYHFRN